MNDVRRSLIASLLVPACGLTHTTVAAQTARGSNPSSVTAAESARFVPISVFADAIGDDETKALAALARIGQEWHESSAALLIEMVHRVPGRRVLQRVFALVEKASGKPFEGSLDAWYEWLWSAERPVHPDYAHFKTLLYAPIDPRFAEYFEGRPKTIIRLDEIRWGGVRRDGIPPLKNPKMISARGSIGAYKSALNRA